MPTTREERLKRKMTADLVALALNAADGGDCPAAHTELLRALVAAIAEWDATAYALGYDAGRADAGRAAPSDVTVVDSETYWRSGYEAALATAEQAILRAAQVMTTQDEEMAMAIGAAAYKVHELLTEARARWKQEDGA